VKPITDDSYVGACIVHVYLMQEGTLRFCSYYAWVEWLIYWSCETVAQIMFIVLFRVEVMNRLKGTVAYMLNTFDLNK
jgi:hypothetical protein